LRQSEKVGREKKKPKKKAEGKDRCPGKRWGALGGWKREKFANLREERAGSQYGPRLKEGGGEVGGVRSGKVGSEVSSHERKAILEKRREVRGRGGAGAVGFLVRATGVEGCGAWS